MPRESQFEGMTPVNIMNVFIESEIRLGELGAIYKNHEVSAPSNFQQFALYLDDEGYSIDEQIFDEYAFLGSILGHVKERM